MDETASIPNQPSITEHAVASTTADTAKSGKSLKGDDHAKKVREEVTSYIRNERDTTLRKWMALSETLKSEDKRRDEFWMKNTKSKNRSIPPPILSFIQNLKQAVKQTVVSKGGDPYGIIRQMLLYWDIDKKGELTVNQLRRCMKSLGVTLSDVEQQSVFSFYAAPGGGMTYNDFLEDFLIGEPTVTEMYISKGETARAYQGKFASENDHRVIPQTVRLFIEALRDKLFEQMRHQGGTVTSLLRYAFLMSDANYSNGLDAKEFVKCVRMKLGLKITQEQAQEIVRFYDTSGRGDMDYHKLSADVHAGLPQFIEHPEFSARTISESYKSMAKNPFIPKAFIATPNKVVEKFKRDLKVYLETRIKAKGGSFKSWIREAFVQWDPTYTGKIADWHVLQGAMGRLGFALSEDESVTIMNAYDKDNNGKVEYKLLIADIVADDPHFLHDGIRSFHSNTPTAREPESVKAIVKKLKRVINDYVRKSQGRIEPRDIFYGTFLRFDSDHSGRVGFEGLRDVSRELRINLSDRDISAMMSWFDSNGTNSLDYGQLTNQLFGEDPILHGPRPSPLPKLANHPSLATSLPNIGIVTEFTSPLPMAAVDDKYFKETRQQKLAKANIHKKQILLEKNRIQLKLQAIEKQRKALLERVPSSTLP